jgi:hypothetical protein
MHDDDDLLWVQALKVSMNLGLIDRSLVPHNLISAQESPVPLPNFKMASRHKIFKSKKGTQIYCAVPSEKSWQPNPPQRGPYGERYPLMGHFYISLDISVYLKGQMKTVPGSWTPSETDAHSRALINIS